MKKINIFILTLILVIFSFNVYSKENKKINNGELCLSEDLSFSKKSTCFEIIDHNTDKFKNGKVINIPAMNRKNFQFLKESVLLLLHLKILLRLYFLVNHDKLVEV